MRKIIATLLTLTLLAAACTSEEETATTAVDEASETTTADEDASHDDTDEEDSHNNDESSHSDEGASHSDGIEITDLENAPTVDLSVTSDELGGQILDITLTNFEISVENASTEPLEGEGHLHLLVDGERTKRFYNEQLYVELEDGEHTLEVEVSANNHAAYTIDGEPIRAAADVVVVNNGDKLVSESELDSTAGVELNVVADPIAGANVTLTTTDFEFANGFDANSTSANTGWVVLTVDGNPIENLIGDSAHIKLAEPGTYEIAAQLVSASGAALTNDTGVIRAAESVTIVN